MRKFVPVTVRVKPLSPATAVLGLSDAIVGALTEKAIAEVVAPPGRTTVTFTGPELAMSVAGTTAVSDVALTYVVASAVGPQSTTDPVTKFVPVTVRVNCAPPATADAGLRLVSRGPPVTVKLLVEEGAPPGFATYTGTVPPFATSAVVTAAVSCVALT